MSALDYIREQGSRISCDTMDVSVAKNFYGTKYINATSNQIISYEALGHEGNEDVIERAAEAVLDEEVPVEEQVNKTVYRAMAMIGKPMADEVDGCVLSQTAPTKAFNTDATVKNARDLIAAFGAEGIPKERVIIKVPATWEGLQACKILSAEGINVLGTMIFTLVQAIVAAQCNCTAISPYVNPFEIHKNKQLWYERYDSGDILNQPGVALAKKVHEYYRAHNVKTQHVPAGMVDVREAIALAGVDEFTILPPMLISLSTLTSFDQKSVLDHVERGSASDDAEITESEFRWQLETNPRAARDLADAINAFYEFEVKLDEAAQNALERSS